MSQLHKRKSMVSGEMEALTQGPPAVGTQGPSTPAQVDPVPASVRRSRRAAVSAVLTAAEFLDEPRIPQVDSTDAASAAVAGKVARQRRKKTVGIAADAADDPDTGSLAPAPSVVVAATVRRSRRKAAAASPTDAALSVEPDPSAEPELAIPVKRVRRKKTARAEPELPVIIQDSVTAAVSAEEAAPAKKPHAARRRAAVAILAPADAAAAVDAPPLPALTVERMPAAIAHLSAADPLLAPIIAKFGPHKRLVLKSGSTFASLSRSIVYQQLAGSAADAIFKRVLLKCECDEELSPIAVLAVAHEELRGCGLSNNKASYVLSLAQHFSDGLLSDDALYGMSEAELVTELTKVRGIGRWTADMFAMFHLGRPDVLPVGDLGVRKGFQVLYGLKALPEAKLMEQLAEKWRPYRSVGSAYMWMVIDEKSNAKRSTAPVMSD